MTATEQPGVLQVTRIAGIRYICLWALSAVLRDVRLLISRKRMQRGGFGAFADALDDRLHRAFSWSEILRIGIERRLGLSQPWTVTSRRFTVEDNRSWWNAHDWSRGGEEWTPSEAWKQNIVQRFLNPYMPVGGIIVEIGPGGGRWTEILRTRSSRLYVLDIAETPLRLCAERFRNDPTVVVMMGDGRTIPLKQSSVDALWSYDVFVHVNPFDARSYIGECARVLRSGGSAVIHHPGATSTAHRALLHRSDLTDAMVREFAAGNGLDIVLQTSEPVNEGDVLTVLHKRAC